MKNWETVEELRNIFIRKYIQSELSNELEKACSEEYELMRDYNGRQILELLQNVDDAYGDKKKKNTIDEKEIEVKITYKNNILEVGNTGTSFSKDTIERLCLGRASNKSSQNIGNKGTGFRSLLNDAEWIELYSGEFSIRFSHTFALDLYKKYLKEDSDGFSDLIFEQDKNWKKDYPLCFPVMNCPEEIEPFESEFDTLIRVKLKDSNLNKGASVAKQLQQPFYKSLLFLPNITKIVIETLDGIDESEKITDGKEVLIERKGAERKPEVEVYYVHTNKAEIDDKFADITIAIPQKKDYDFSKEKLYCYFPIRNFGTPINAIIHAPFVTNNSRDDVPDDNDEINKRIFEAVIPFVASVAEELTNSEYGDVSIRMVTPFSANKLWDPDVFGLKKLYLDYIANARILPTVNGEYISIKNNPKMFNEEYPKIFNGEPFEKLLQLSMSEDNNLFLRELADHIDYEELSFCSEDLSDIINRLSDDWSLTTRINVFLWWSRLYKDSTVVPNLLLNNNGKWIGKSDKVYLPTDSGISVLPDELSTWVKLCIVKQSYVDTMISQIKSTRLDEWKVIAERYKAERTSDKRIFAAFSEKYLAIEFTEQSSSDLIISTMNRQIDTFEKSMKFFKWFFENYKEKLSDGSELSKIAFRLPDDTGVIRTSSDLYFGEEYDNPLGDKIFIDSGRTPLANCSKLYTGENKQEFISFLERCGVVRFPKIQDDEKLKNNNKFKRFVRDKYKQEMDFANINYLESKNIPDFDKLIQRLETQDIVNWLKEDNDLRELLYSRKKESKASQQSNWNGLNFYSNEYIKYVLNNTPWIEFEEKRYSPNQIVMYDKLRNNIDGIYGISEIDLISQLGRDIVSSLDFKSNMAQLSDQEIRKILVELPSFDRGEVSRKLYNDIIRNKSRDKPNYSTDGLVLLGKDGDFYQNTELRYADKKLPKTMGNQTCFIWIPEKASTTTIRDWLGVERFNTNLVLKEYVQNENGLEDFKTEIDNIKTALLSTIDANSNNVAKLRKMKIIPCTNIQAEDTEQDNQLIALEDYYFVEEGNLYYLKIPIGGISIIQLRQTEEFASSIIDMFKQLLTLDIDANLIELLISKDTDSKKDRISNNFGVDKWNDSYKLLFDEDAVNKRVVAFFEEHNYTFAEDKTLLEIDFAYALNEADYEFLIRVLKSISKDIIDINDLSELINLDIREYWNKKYKQYLDKNFEKYRKNLYLKAKQGSESEKEIFLNRVNDYGYPQSEKIDYENSIHVSIEEYAMKNFPELKDRIQDECDVDEIYNNNVAIVIQDAKIKATDFDYYIRKNPFVNSALYFGIPDKIAESINSFLKMTDNELEDDEVLVPTGKTATISTRLEPVNGNAQKKSTNHGKSERSQTEYDNRNASNEKAGEEAENIAYVELTCNQKLKVIWHSKYSKNHADRNNLPPNNIVCDMWVKDPDKGNIYFEVKSAVSEFEMTINEYDSMLKNPDNYEVILVNVSNKTISRYKIRELDPLKRVSGYLFKFNQSCIESKFDS